MEHVRVDGYSTNYRAIEPDLLAQLKWIEEQVRGIRKMIDEDHYCMDILVQISAIRNAIHNVAFPLLERHTHCCVVGAIVDKKGEMGKIEELMGIFQQFMKI